MNFSKLSSRSVIFRGVNSLSLDPTSVVHGCAIFKVGRGANYPSSDLTPVSLSRLSSSILGEGEGVNCRKLPSTVGSRQLCCKTTNFTFTSRRTVDEFLTCNRSFSELCILVCGDFICCRPLEVINLIQWQINIQCMTTINFTRKCTRNRKVTSQEGIILSRFHCNTSV